MATPEPLERVTDDATGAELALVIRAGFGQPGINFVTDDESVHQLGVLKWPQGHLIDAHVHNPMARTIDSTQEVLFIRSGRVRVDLYGDDQMVSLITGARSLETSSS